MKLIKALIKAAGVICIIVMCLAILAMMHEYFGAIGYYTTAFILLLFVLTISFYKK